jgi:SAM-dependent methyltransferase
MLTLLERMYSSIPTSYRLWLKEKVPQLVPAVVKFRSYAWRKKLLRYSQRPRDQVFSTIFIEGGWGGESLSGPGSSLVETRAIRTELPRLMNRLNIRSILDAPCGDYFWLSSLELGVDEYLGIDIVPSLIAKNERLFASPSIRFEVADIVNYKPAAFDLILCRDCLVHLSFADSIAALKTFLNSQCRYLLTTTFPATAQNSDIVTGGWRPLNLQAAPFFFPDPIELTNEQYSGGVDGRFSDKSLGLWDIQTLKSLRGESFKS